MKDQVKFFIKDRLTANDVCYTHSLAYHEATKRMMQKGYPAEAIKHVFDDDKEEFVLYDRVGYHIGKAFAGEGRMEINVHWGEFVATNHGKKWVDRSEEGIWLPN